MMHGLAPGWPLAWPWLALGLALAGPWPGPGWPLAWPWLAREHPKDHQSTMPSAGVRILQNGSYAYLGFDSPASAVEDRQVEKDFLEA